MLDTRAFNDGMDQELSLIHIFQPEEINLINDWIQVLELPEEVVLMLLQIEMENSRGRVSISIAGRRAKEWAQSGIRTVDDVEKIVVMGREREQQLRKLLARLGQRRTPSEDEKAMYKDVYKRQSLYGPPRRRCSMMESMALSPQDLIAPRPKRIPLTPSAFLPTENLRTL